MPPKPKFTREEIVQTALEVVSRKGVEALTAKELGDALRTADLYRVQQHEAGAGRGAGGRDAPV